MTAVWPENVRQDHDPATLTESPVSNVADFAPDVGPPKRRRRSSVVSALIAYETTLDKAELASLIAFYRGEIEDGALPFQRKHPRTRDLGRFLFEQPPSIRGMTRTRFRVAIQLRELPS